MIPRLLVSVRNVQEAQTVLQVGCAVVDVKEPDRGPLGMASLEVCRDVADAVARWNSESLNRCAVSLALGDAPDWRFERKPVDLPEVDYIKLGTAGLADVDWPTCWSGAISAVHVAANTQKVIVAYADWQSARAPSPNAVAFHAAELGCRGMLIDTWDKSGRTILDCLSREMLTNISSAVKARGLWFAIAGGLGIKDLTKVAAIQPDIIGIRGAACLGRRRTDVIDADALRTFREALRQTKSDPRN